MEDKLKVELTRDYFKESAYWIICKFGMDNFKREQSSSKQALIGGFIDRWLNKVPEFLIFNELLKDKNYTVITDKFLYSTQKAKNAPDILGLIDSDENIYPFTQFIDDSWVDVPNMPFIEMKTFRGSQNLITIPKTQFVEDHYYALINSHLNENYLIFLFDPTLFSDDKYYKGLLNLDKKELIVSNNKGVIQKPQKFELDENLGYYELIGIYKGSDLAKFSKLIEQGDKPLYFFEETEPPKKCNKNKIVSPPIYLNSGLYYFDNNTDNLPCYIKIGENSELKIYCKIKTAIDVCVKGNVSVDGIKLSQGKRRLSFKEFEKNGSGSEMAMTKSIIKCYDNEISATEELKKKFDDIVGAE